MRTTIILEAAWSTILIAVAQQPAGQSTAQLPSTAAPKAQPSPMPQEKATHPGTVWQCLKKTQKNSVGKGALSVTTAQPVDFRQEEVAYSGASRVTTDFLYNPIGVLYRYREDDLKCANGQSAHGGILEGR